MESGRCIVVLAASVFLSTAVASAQAQNTRGFFEPQRKQYLEGLAQYTLINQHKIDDVFHLRVDNGHLTLTTPLNADHDYLQRRAELEGMSEPAVILCWYISQDLGQIQFELNVDNYSDPLVFGRLHLLARPVMKDKDNGGEIQSIDIEKTWQTRTGCRTVFFNQTANGVRLTISDRDGGSNGFGNVNIAEKDFPTLRRDHHAETEKWLRPVLRELHQESVFAADPATAWQVLSAEWPIDPKYATSVLGLVKQLDDDDFRVRRKSADALQKLGREAALVMLKMDRRGLSLEQNLRIDEVIGRFKPLSAREADQLGKDLNFLLDCLFSDDPTARKLALARLRTIAGKPIDFDLNAAEDARIDAVNALRAKLFAGDGAKP